MGERLQKYLARAGIASRRRAEELIELGAVLVNGQPVPVGTQIDPAVDVVTFRGRLVQPEQEKLYLMLNKPTDVVTTASDPQGRRTVLDLLPPHRQRVYPVGRLDRDSSGLLLLTNDGDFAYALTHPKFKVEKVYQAQVRGVPTPESLQQLRAGVQLDDGPTAPAKVTLLAQQSGGALLELVIHEGRKRQVRRMCAVVGHPVLSLQRIRFGNLGLGGLAVGQVRQLTEAEVAALLQQSGHGEDGGGKSGANADS